MTSYAEEDESFSYPDESSDSEEHQSFSEEHSSSMDDLYDIKATLGKGQFGTVYLCINKKTSKEVAVKRIKCDSPKEATGLYRTSLC